MGDGIQAGTALGGLEEQCPLTLGVDLVLTEQQWIAAVEVLVPTTCTSARLPSLTCGFESKSGEESYKRLFQNE
eukprot:497330-Prorocentrum_minimum.AAC.1